MLSTLGIQCFFVTFLKPIIDRSVVKSIHFTHKSSLVRFNGGVNSINGYLGAKGANRQISPIT